MIPGLPPRRAAPTPPNPARGPGQGEALITVASPELDARPATSGSHSGVRGANGTGQPDDLLGHTDGALDSTAKAGTACSEKSAETRPTTYRPFSSRFSHFEEDDALNANMLPADMPIYGMENQLQYPQGSSAASPALPSKELGLTRLPFP